MFSEFRLFKPINIALAIIIFLPINIVMASESSEFFAKGVQYSNNKDYQAALQQFRAAQKSGMHTAVLRYNIAVSYYRLGKYENSKFYFTDLLDDPKFTTISYYNLGLIALKQNKLNYAEFYFKRVISLADNKALLRLSNTALQRLAGKYENNRFTEVSSSRDSQALVKEPESSVSGYISLSALRDDNVGLVNDDLEMNTRVEDSAAELFAYTSFTVIGDSHNGFDAVAALDRIEYNDEANSIYNYTSNMLSLENNKKGRAWESNARISLEKTEFGKQDYLTVHHFKIQGKRYFPNKNYLRVNYTYSSYKSDNDIYLYLEGEKHSVNFDITVPVKAHKYRLGFISEINDREDLSNMEPVPLKPYVAQRSYSPTRITLFARYYYRFSNTLQLLAELEYRNSRYGSDDVLINPGNPTLRYQRVDNRKRIKLSATRKLSEGWHVSLLFDHMDNDSNRQSFVNAIAVDSQSYQRSQIKLSLGYLF